VRLVAFYASRAALAVDVEQQLGRGALLVRGDVPPKLQMYEDVELEIACADGTPPLVVPAQVIQMFPAMGVAVQLDREACARISAHVDGAGAEPEEPVHVSAAPPPQDELEIDLEPSSAALPVPPRAGTLPGAATMEKIQAALRGDRDARMAVLRSPNRTLHIHVLRNPGLTLDEISAIARMTTVSVEVLKQIAERREWGHRPEIAIALVRNPTVPPPLAIALLDHVSIAELRQLAKDTRTREPIQKAARRKILS
jgi:hypothetical protein